MADAKLAAQKVCKQVLGGECAMYHCVVSYCWRVSQVQPVDVVSLHWPQLPTLTMCFPPVDDPWLMCRESPLHLASRRWRDSAATGTDCLCQMSPTQGSSFLLCAFTRAGQKVSGPDLFKIKEMEERTFIFQHNRHLCRSLWMPVK